MINLKQEILNYSSINLKSLASDENDIPDNIKNSVILYNKALESIRLDSEDIAIIELKKAISMNSNFHEAMNLLGICYSYTKEYVKAAEVFEKVIAAENNSIKALKYLGLLNSNETSSKVMESKNRSHKKDDLHNEKVKRSLSILDDIINLKRNWKVDLKKYLIGFLFCLLLVLIIGFIAYKPSDKVVTSSTNQETTSSTEETNTNNTTDIKVSEELTKAKSDLENAMAQIDYYKNTLKLYEVESLLAAGEYEAAADMLILLKSVNYEGQEKEKLDKLYSSIMPKAAGKLKDEAWVLLKNKKYQDSLDKLTKIQLYGNDWPFMDFSYYCMGRCFLGLSDSKAALEAFKKIVDSYPKSGYMKYAQSKIKELTSFP